MFVLELNYFLKDIYTKTENIRKIPLEISQNFQGDIHNLQTKIHNLSQEIENFSVHLRDSLDWEQLNDFDKKYIDNILNLIECGWKRSWFLCDELIDYLLDEFELSEEFLFKEERVIEYLESNFERLSNRVITSIYFSNHRKLLLDSKKLFLEERYAISIFPLFSAFDNLFTRWSTEQNLDGKDVNTKYVNMGLKKKLKEKEDNYNPRKTLDFSHLIIYSTFKAFNTFFSSSNKKDELNRNIIMHGNYIFEELSRVECLKLWSSLVLLLDFVELIILEDE